MFCRGAYPPWEETRRKRRVHNHYHSLGLGQWTNSCFKFWIFSYYQVKWFIGFLKSIKHLGEWLVRWTKRWPNKWTLSVRRKRWQLAALSVSCSTTNTLVTDIDIKNEHVCSFIPHLGMVGLVPNAVMMTTFWRFTDYQVNWCHYISIAWHELTTISSQSQKTSNLYEIVRSGQIFYSSNLIKLCRNTLRGDKLPYRFARLRC